MFVKFIKSDDVRRNLTILVVVNDLDSTFKVDRNNIAYLFSCNHEEADSRMVLHASFEDVNCVVCSKDTDAMVLLAYAYTIKRPNKSGL